MQILKQNVDLANQKAQKNTKPITTAVNVQLTVIVRYPSATEQIPYNHGSQNFKIQIVLFYFLMIIVEIAFPVGKRIFTIRSRTSAVTKKNIFYCNNSIYSQNL